MTSSSERWGSDMAERLNQETFDAFLQGREDPVLVDFYRDGCIPCRRVSPLVSRAEETYAGRLEVARVNIDQNPALVARYQIEAAPTLLLFQGEEETGRCRGVINQEELTALIQEALSQREGGAEA